MPEQRQIDFYHLKDKELATPVAMLAHKSVGIGQKMLILSTDEHMDAVSDALWASSRESFLAHGRNDEKGADTAPVWLCSDAAANPNKASYVCLTSGLVPPDPKVFQRIFVLFDGTRETAIAFARSCWKDWSCLEGVQCCYFVQDDAGLWVKRR